MQVFVEGAESGEAEKEVALLAPIFAEVGGRVAQRVLEGELQKTQLDGLDALILDGAGIAQFRQFLLGFRFVEELLNFGRESKIVNRLYVEIDQVLVEDAAGKVGTGVDTCASAAAQAQKSRRSRKSPQPQLRGDRRP